MAKELGYYKIRMMISCGNNSCMGKIYLSGKGLDLKIAHANVDSSSKRIESDIEKISEEEFEKAVRKKVPLKWYD